MDDLETKTPQELRTMLKQLGAKSPRGAIGRDKLIALVKKARGKFEIDQSPSGVVGVPKGEASIRKDEERELEQNTLVNSPDLPSLITDPEKVQPPASMSFMAETQDKPKPAFNSCSEQEVIAAVKNYAARGMTIKFLDNTWEFRKGDKVDCGTMSQPVYNIIKCAEALCRESVSATRMFMKS